MTPTKTAIPDRAQLLAALVEHYRDTPFAWGAHDCCLWPAAAVQAQRGDDPAAAYRGRYGSGKEARELIRIEFAGQIENIPGQLGFEEVPVLKAKRGFIVSTSFPRRGIALGVCIGTKAAFAGPAGLVFVPMVAVRRAWRV